MLLWYLFHLLSSIKKDIRVSIRVTSELVLRFFDRFLISARCSRCDLCKPLTLVTRGGLNTSFHLWNWGDVIYPSLFLLFWVRIRVRIRIRVRVSIRHLLIKFVDKITSPQFHRWKLVLTERGTQNAPWLLCAFSLAHTHRWRQIHVSGLVFSFLMPKKSFNKPFEFLLYEISRLYFSVRVSCNRSQRRRNSV